mmetsp:Transcript_30083/g.51188  ORF Transcript_30083/g.51188 Transcript_30083/m.51188 type:complete len:193 (-) Transcript_30083:528-1106(-)
MGKSKGNSNKVNTAKKAKATITKSGGGGGGGGGLDEIDSLFAQKKQSHKELQHQISQEEELAKKERKRRKQARLEEEADEIALRGAASSSGAAAAAGARKGDATAPAALHEKAQKLSSLTYTRSDVEKLNTSTNKEAKDKWATDGLGGVFNGEGFTGRRDDGGHRVFKAHLMNKEGFGDTPDCPFDCNCCFI